MARVEFGSVIGCEVEGRGRLICDLVRHIACVDGGGRFAGRFSLSGRGREAHPSLLQIELPEYFCEGRAISKQPTFFRRFWPLINGRKTGCRDMRNDRVPVAVQ